MSIEWVKDSLRKGKILEEIVYEVKTCYKASIEEMLKDNNGDH